MRRCCSSSPSGRSRSRSSSLFWCVNSSLALKLLFACLQLLGHCTGIGSVCCRFALRRAVVFLFAGFHGICFAFAITPSLLHLIDFARCALACSVFSLHSALTFAIFLSILELITECMITCFPRFWFLLAALQSTLSQFRVWVAVYPAIPGAAILRVANTALRSGAPICLE